MSPEPAATHAAPAALAETCARAARRAGAFIREHTGRVAQGDWQVKTRADFVSAVDLGAEQLITGEIRRDFPSATVVGEELAPEGELGTGLVFIVDPLDGTTNFLHQYPQYAVSIAAAINGVVEAGVVFDVPRDALYVAVRGHGARCNGERLHVSPIAEPERALIGTGFPFKDPGQLAPYLPQFARVAAQTSGVRRAGAAALDLADVASGRLDAFWELMLAPWDMAAGMLLVREAGGRVTDLHGVDVGPGRTGLVASNGTLHSWLLQQL